MTMAMTAADRTAADLINLAVAGLTADVTALLLLLSPAGSGGGLPEYALLCRRTVGPEGEDAADNVTPNVTLRCP